jgi:hypothetical protein
LLYPVWFRKLVLILDKIYSKWQDKNKNFCSSLNQRTTFCPWNNYKKYENTHFVFENKKYYLSFYHWCNFVLSYFTLLCHILFCSVLIILQIKRTLCFSSLNCIQGQTHVALRMCNRTRQILITAHAILFYIFLHPLEILLCTCIALHPSSLDFSHFNIFYSILLYLFIILLQLF